MNGVLRDGAVTVGGNARQQFHDARGYGTPADGDEIRLARVEAAHLLLRGDIDAVVDNGDGLDFAAFFAASAAADERFPLRFLVYADLRDRGFYLSPAREGWPGATDDERTDLTVAPRGTKPGAGEPAHRVVVVGERESIPAADLAGLTLAVVDEESEISYLDTSEPAFDGGTSYSPPADITGALIGDRVVVWDAPDGFHERGFYGQPLEAREATLDGVVQLSLIEAAALAAEGQLVVPDADDDSGHEEATLTATGVAGEMMPDSQATYTTIRERGREVDGERFDRRLAVYRALRDRQVVPKTGYKFGADFRTYNTVESVEALPHSERLVRVVAADHTFDPRDLSLDVRLAGGVRKRMVFALTGANGEIDWLAVSRLTP
ncbi:MAG: tRNA-intron endonuclease [uncultured archaeon A07HN63]|nr:MAG: tRNA-intron endonuclease [uncultured archaeon A07HN63]